MHVFHRWLHLLHILLHVLRSGRSRLVCPVLLLLQLSCIQPCSLHHEQLPFLFLQVHKKDVPLPDIRFFQRSLMLLLHWLPFLTPALEFPVFPSLHGINLYLLQDQLQMELYQEFLLHSFPDLLQGSVVSDLRTVRSLLPVFLFHKCLKHLPVSMVQSTVCQMYHNL